MTTDARIQNWFERGGQAYARFRPEYPLELTRFLADLAPSHERAVDVGCGNGQLTAQLAAYFDEAIGLDPSAEQIANAPVRKRIRYIRAPAERLPLPDRCASLITAAQAAHWFDLPAFYAEVRRIAADGAVVALISYGGLDLDRVFQERFSRFYCDEIGPYWPPERQLVDSGYRDMSFPFEEREAPQMKIRQMWELSDFLGYISTWSAVRRAADAGCADILDSFVKDISELWGDPMKQQPVCWPINMRVGML